jgi:iron(III) transport system substrate-binding protein
MKRVWHRCGLMGIFRSTAWGIGLATCLCFVGFAPAEEVASQAGIDLVIGSTTPSAEAEEVIKQFNTLNPGVRIQHPKILSTDLFESVVNPNLAKSPIDVVWSSAMDLQIKLANDGYAAEYTPADIAEIPSWAQWKGRAYAVTAEPVVIIFNKRLLREDLVPRDRADLLRVLTESAESFRGKIATYDPELSGTGLLFITQDLRVTAQTWKLVAAMGNAGVKLYASSLPMIDRVCSGELLLAYNVMASYALERAKRDSDLGIVFPSDYILLFSRIVLIPQTARRPELAKLFVNFLLSKEGQELLARHSLGSVRDDMKSSIPGFAEAGPVFRPISLSLDLLTYLDQSKRKRFLKDWREALRGQ